MKLYLVSVALIAAFAQQASAITFPSLTTIYVGVGVLDDGGGSETGTASSFFCSNVSGLTAQVRVLILLDAGQPVGSQTQSVAHGATIVVSTHATILNESPLATGFVQGAVNIESTQSGVFCRGAVVNAAGPREDSSPIDLVRVNPHPGTVE